MTRDFQDMLYLFSCGARGKEPQQMHEINIRNVYQFSVSQNVWPTVFLAVKSLYQQGKLEMDHKLFENWNLDILHLTMRNTKRNFEVLKTINYLEENGITCIVLKGEVVSRLYHTPVCRVSSDTDLFIDRDKEETVIKLLKKYGYQVEKRPKNSHHLNCYHPVAGNVEIHVAMYYDTTDDVLLNNKIKYTEPYIPITNADGYEFKTLGITDGLIYLTVHFIKHFINKGVGIRQLMDLLLYVVHYQNEIKWDEFRQLLKYLKYDKFLNHLYGIGVQYLNFDPAELPSHIYDEKLAEKIVTDMEEGGIFGHESNERANFYDLYLKERYHTFKSGDFSDYMNQQQKKILFEKFFPNYKTMLKYYPYVKHTKILLPVAWLQRFWKLSFAVLIQKKKISDYLNYIPADEKQEVKQRMDLIRQLDMI